MPELEAGTTNKSLQQKAWISGLEKKEIVSFTKLPAVEVAQKNMTQLKKEAVYRTRKKCFSME